MVKAFEASQEKLFFGTRICVKKHEGFGWLIFISYQHTFLKRIIVKCPLMLILWRIKSCVFISL